MSYCTQNLEEALAVQEEARKAGKRIKVEVSDGSGFGSNALRFETAEAAMKYADDLFCRWMAAKEYRLAVDHEDKGMRESDDKDWR